MDKIYLVKPDGIKKLLASTDIAKSMSYHKLEMAVNSAGSMEVDLPSNNEKLKNINFLSDEITFERENKEIFRGCPSGSSADFLMTGGLRVTGMLGYLGNAYIPPYEYKGSVKGYVQLLLDAYNKNCGKKRPISLGTVTVTDPNDVIVRSDSGYRNVLELVQEKLVGMLGGYVSVTMKDGVRTLDYLSDPPQSGQSIKYGKNLLDISQDTEYQTVYTVLIPIGATTTNDDGTTAFVDITSVNGGIYYIYDANAVEKYGWREKYIQFEDITIPSNLLNKAKAYLSTLLSPVKSMTVKAIDLALYSGDEPFLPGRKVLVKSAYNNVDTSLTISSVTMFALEPEEEVIEIGASVSTYTEQSASNASSVAAEFINLKLNSLNVDSADIRYLKTVNLEAEVAKLGYVKADVIEANYVKTIYLEAEVAKLGYVTAGTVEAQYARLDKANIGTGWIDSAMIGEGVVGAVQIADGSITDAKIVELTANKITAGTLSVERLEIRGTANSIVYALNNITGALQAQNVDTLNGEILTPRSITADRIVAGAITAKEIAAGAITANHILAGAITADKLDVRDLSAISALIGGWELLDGVIRAEYAGRYCGIGRENTAYAFFAGGASNNGSDGVFRVGHDGSLVATNAAITGNITATTLLVQQSIHSETTTIIDTTGTINYKNLMSTNAEGGYNSYLGIYAESDQYAGSRAVDRAKITFALNDIRAYNGAREADINLYASGYIRISADEQVVINDCTFNGTTSFGGDLLTSGGIADGAGWMDFKYGGTLYGSIYCNGTANHFEIVSRNGKGVAITAASGHIYARNTLHTEGGISNDNWMDWWYSGSNNLSIYVESRHAFIRANSGHLDILTQEALVQFVDYSWNAWAVLKAKQFAVQSSKRYKTNVVDMTEERAKRLLQMRPVSYDYTVMGCEKDQLGMIAEEVDAIDKFALSYDEYGRPDSLDYSKFVPQLIKLCQMQQTEIENIKMRLGNIGTVS